MKSKTQNKPACSLILSLCLGFGVKKIETWQYFIKIQSGYFKNLRTNSRRVFSHLNAFYLLNPNIAMIIWIPRMLENSLVTYIQHLRGGC